MTASATAAVVSANAAVMAVAAQKTACVTAVKGYQQDNATVAEAQVYARCVGLIYPYPLSASAAIWVKAAVVLALLLGGYGAWRGYKEDSGDALGVVLGVIIGLLLGPCVIGLAWLVAAGIGFLFT